jgi:hypothetical protein
MPPIALTDSQMMAILAAARRSRSQSVPAGGVAQLLQAESRRRRPAGNRGCHVQPKKKSAPEERAK